MTALAARLIAILVLATVAGLALLTSAAPPKLRGAFDANGNSVTLHRTAP